MDFLIVLIVTLAAVFVLHDPIKKAPVLFYALAVCAVALLFAGSYGLLGKWWTPGIMLVQRCMIAFALFAIVMFTGALPRDLSAAKMLRSIRSELSIVACILCLGHVCMYLAPYALRALAGSMNASMLVSFAVAMLLFVLLLVLGVTSFGAVKRRMPSAAWKNAQRFAYAFFGLAYVHLMFMLAPSAALGGVQAQASIAIYSAVVVAYAMLRLHRAWKDRSLGIGSSDLPMLDSKGDSPKTQEAF